MHRIIFAVLLLATGRNSFAGIERVWLTHGSSDPGRIVVNWQTTEPGNSIVYYGTTSEYGNNVSISENVTLHHVEIPLTEKDVVYHYCVGSGVHRSADATFKGYPTQVLRVAVVANWHARPNLDAILKDDVHLLMTAGDNITNIWKAGGIGARDCIRPYADLIDAYPGLFRSIPFMPVLGNHDKEIRPRGDKPPAQAVYDIDATAFREFFELPGDEWKWYFDVPDFDVRFVSLDFNHISDFGTTWQSCHSYERGSDQYQWYKGLMIPAKKAFTVTLYNEKNSSIRNKEKPNWHSMFVRGTICISGFGHFAERAVPDGVAYYNTSLNGTGSRYPDPKSVFLASEDNYILMTFVKETKEMKVDIKGLDGSILDTARYSGSTATRAARSCGPSVSQQETMRWLESDS